MARQRSWPPDYNPIGAPTVFVEDSTGAPDADKGVKLDATGKLTMSVMPAGIVGALTYKGTIDAALNPPYPVGPAIGDYWRITSNGTVGGDAVSKNDVIIYNGVAWDIVVDYMETDQIANNSTVPDPMLTAALDRLYNVDNLQTAETSSNFIIRADGVGGLEWVQDTISVDTDYYIDPVAGDDANDGLVGNPWKTLNHMRSMIEGKIIDGCTVTVHASGVFTETSSIDDKTVLRLPNIQSLRNGAMLIEGDARKYVGQSYTHGNTRRTSTIFPNSGTVDGTNIALSGGSDYAIITPSGGTLITPNVIADGWGDGDEMLVTVGSNIYRGVIDSIVEGTYDVRFNFKAASWTQYDGTPIVGSVDLSSIGTDGDVIAFIPNCSLVTDATLGNCVKGIGNIPRIKGFLLDNRVGIGGSSYGAAYYLQANILDGSTYGVALTQCMMMNKVSSGSYGMYCGYANSQSVAFIGSSSFYGRYGFYVYGCNLMWVYNVSGWGNQYGAITSSANNTSSIYYSTGTRSGSNVINCLGGRVSLSAAGVFNSPGTSPYGFYFNECYRVLMTGCKGNGIGHRTVQASGCGEVTITSSTSANVQKSEFYSPVTVTSVGAISLQRTPWAEIEYTTIYVNSNTYGIENYNALIRFSDYTTTIEKVGGATNTVGVWANAAMINVGSGALNIKCDTGYLLLGSDAYIERGTITVPMNGTAFDITGSRVNVMTPTAIVQDGGASGTTGFKATNNSLVYAVGVANAADTPVEADVDNRWGNNLSYVLTTASDYINVPDPVGALNVANKQWVESVACGGVPYDESAAALVTAVDGAKATNMVMGFTPALNGYVEVAVNGILKEVGVDCYFSGDGGTTPRARGAVVAGDTLHWNGSVTSYELDTNDEITFIYNK